MVFLGSCYLFHRLAMSAHPSTILVLLIFEFICGLPVEGRWGSTRLFTQSGTACFPNQALYKGESKEKDISAIDSEAGALEYTTNAKKWKKTAKTATSKISQVAGLFMHSYNIAIKSKFDERLKEVNDKIADVGTKMEKLNKNADAYTKLSSAKSSLQRSLKGLNFLSKKLAPALGVFGAVFSIVSGFFGGNENQAVDLLRKEMHAGFKKLREDMNRKYMELKDYVDDTVQFAQVVDLEAELEVVNFLNY